MASFALWKVVIEVCLRIICVVDDEKPSVLQVREPMLRRTHIICDATNFSNVLKCLFGELVRAGIDPEDSPIAMNRCQHSMLILRQRVLIQLTFVGKGTRICSKIVFCRIHLNRKWRYVSVIQLCPRQRERWMRAWGHPTVLFSRYRFFQPPVKPRSVHLKVPTIPRS